MGTVTQVKEDACPSNTWKIKILYDGDCPLCMREVYLSLLTHMILFLPANPQDVGVMSTFNNLQFNGEHNHLFASFFRLIFSGKGIDHMEP